MPNYNEPDVNQSQLMCVSFEEQIKPGTFEYALHYIIENHIDVSVFDKNYKNDDTGRPAYSPKTLLKIVLLAYSQGITHSRDIARECEKHVIYMALTGGVRPHFTTIAHFVSSMKDQIVSIFRDVIVLCHTQGLIGKQMFAIDGCKISSNCSKEWSGTKKQIRKKMKKLESSLEFLVGKHKEYDKHQEPSDKVKKIKKAIETTESKIAKMAKWLETFEDKKGCRNKPIQSNITDNESARMPSSKGNIQGYTGVATADSKHQVVVQAEAHGQNQEKKLLKPSVEDIKETFEERELDDNILEKTEFVGDTGFHSNANIEYLEEEGIDGYLPDNHFRNRDPKFKNAEKHRKRTGNIRGRHVPKFYKPEDFKYGKGKKCLICPAGKVLEMHLRKHKNTSGLIGPAFKAQASDCNACRLSPHCRRGKGSGPRVVAKYTHRAPDTPVTPTQRMIKKIDTDKGRFTYSRRMGVIEPVFGHICNTMGLDYFNLRGKVKVDIQWKLFCMVHNLKKIFKYGKGPAFA